MLATHASPSLNRMKNVVLHCLQYEVVDFAPAQCTCTYILNKQLTHNLFKVVLLKGEEKKLKFFQMCSFNVLLVTY